MAKTTKTTTKQSKTKPVQAYPSAGGRLFGIG
jgi:hypothetical protein